MTASTVAMKMDTGVCRTTPLRLTPTASRIAAGVILRRTKVVDTPRQSSGGTFTVAANRQWTPTGIRVNQGEVLRFSSAGEIHFSGNAADRAGVAGSPDHKFIGGAPLPGALAGALIGRIDNGLPFGIGDQTTITVPASGLLYLGTNDDNVSDNSGQFQVVISR